MALLEVEGSCKLHDDACSKLTFTVCVMSQHSHMYIYVHVLYSCALVMTCMCKGIMTLLTYLHYHRLNVYNYAVIQIGTLMHSYTWMLRHKNEFEDTCKLD